MENAISKSALKELQDNAATMSDTDFREQGTAMLNACWKIVEKAIKDSKVATKDYIDAAKIEIKALNSMIESDEQSADDKKLFAARIAELVNSFRTNKWIKDGAVVVGVLGLGALALWVWKTVSEKK